MATVFNGTVHAVSSGKATVTATISIGGHDYSAKCLVTVSGASDSARIFVKYVSASNGLAPQGGITLAGNTVTAGDIVTIPEGSIST